MTGKSCENCNDAPAAWFCNSDGAYLCTACDVSIHSANKLAMRHERIPMAAKLENDAACQPCEPAGGYVNRLNSTLERRSVNHGGHDGEQGPGPSSMDWLMHQNDLMGHSVGGHDLMGHHNAGGDDPLSSLLHMEQEGQGNNSDFGGFGDDLFSIPAANPSGIFSSGAHARARAREGSGDEHAGAHKSVHGDSNSSGNSGTSDCTNNAGFGAEKTSGGAAEVGELETTLTRPFATSALRQAQLQRYRAKRLARHLGHKKIRYECRKTLADNRPRIKGRFAKVLPEGMAAAQSCPDLPSLGKRAQSEEPTKQSSGDSTGGLATKGRRSRLSGGSDANSGLVKGKGGKGAATKKEKARRDSDGSEQIAETDDGLGHLRSSTRGGLPYTQSEVSLAQLDRAGRW